MIRRRLAACNQGHVHVLPVIVTSLRREEVRADVEGAERQGVLIVTAEGLKDGIEKSRFLPSAERIYTDAEERVSIAKAKYDPPVNGLPILPL